MEINFNIEFVPQMVILGRFCMTMSCWWEKQQTGLDYAHGHRMLRRKPAMISILLYIVYTSTHFRNG